MPLGLRVQDMIERYELRKIFEAYFLLQNSEHNNANL